MWSAVGPIDVNSPAPSARSKHSATLVGDCIYVLGGRNGNLPMKDFWKYNLVTGKWRQLHPTGDKLPSLQEHTAVFYKDNMFVFGGEVGFSAGTETPLWSYDIRTNHWRKIRSRKGVSNPKGRRGHTALLHRDSMLIYGGYQDLKGSSSELWAWHFDTESWHLLSSNSITKTNGTIDIFPPPRHKHSAVIHNDAMWIYGGMTDLQERSDLWKWDIASKMWTNIRTKLNPGALHSHAACRLAAAMMLFGGERNGHPTNELWKFNFSLETWEKITIGGLKPQPRSETIALTVSEFTLSERAGVHNSMERRAVRIRARTCTSADRGNRHSSYLPHNKVAPCEEKTYVFQPSQTNYHDGSDYLGQDGKNSGQRTTTTKLLQEFSKLSQINIARLNNKCNYTVLTGAGSGVGCGTSDSTESLLRQHASPAAVTGNDNELILMDTPTKSAMVKSKSAYVIKKKYYMGTSPPASAIAATETTKEQSTKTKRIEFDSKIKVITREPISVPNFSLLTLPTPVLSPVEATKLVYLDTDDENEFVMDNSSDTHLISSDSNYNLNNDQDDGQFIMTNKVQRGESYSSHLGYADNPLYQHMIVNNQNNKNSSTSAAVAAVKFKDSSKLAESYYYYDGNVSSTSDYASIETVNRLSSASNYSVKTNTPLQDDSSNNINNTAATRNNNIIINNKDDVDEVGPFGFCNPNYLGPNIEKRNIVNLLNCPDKNNMSSEDDIDSLELQNMNGIISKNSTKVYYSNKHSSRTACPPKFLALHSNQHQHRSKMLKNRALSAGRADRNTKTDDTIDQHVVTSSFDANERSTAVVDPFVPLYVYIVGGKEQGQVTVFQRPISIWKLKLY